MQECLQTKVIPAFQFFNALFQNCAKSASWHSESAIVAQLTNHRFAFTLAQLNLPRALTDTERNLVKWMIEHGTGDTSRFLSQLDSAKVCSHCPCGCASIDFMIGNFIPDQKSGMNLFADFVYGDEKKSLFGAFVFSIADTLAGLEVYSLSGDDVPRELPKPEELRPLENSARR